MATVNIQDIGHPADHDYEAGSPHLRHRSIRDGVVSTIRDAVQRQGQRAQPVRVLKTGASHGSFALVCADRVPG